MRIGFHHAISGDDPAANTPPPLLRPLLWSFVGADHADRRWILEALADMTPTAQQLHALTYGLFVMTASLRRAAQTKSWLLPAVGAC